MPNKPASTGIELRTVTLDVSVSSQFTKPQNLTRAKFILVALDRQRKAPLSASLNGWHSRRRLIVRIKHFELIRFSATSFIGWFRVAIVRKS